MIILYVKPVSFHISLSEGSQVLTGLRNRGQVARIVQVFSAPEQAVVFMDPTIMFQTAIMCPPVFRNMFLETEL